MVSYKARSGVLLTRLCDEYLLVATISARQFCPYVTVLNESAAFVWERLVEGASFEDLEAAVAQEYEIEDPDELRRLLLGMLENLKNNGYLLTDEQGGEHEE